MKQALIVACLLVSALSRMAVACSCLPVPLQVSLQNADVVFRGKLVAHRFGKAIFEVHEQWKGAPARRISVEWRDGTHGDCNGFWPDDLKIGNELLVFARRTFLTYKTSICLPTKMASKAQELHDLGPGKS